MQEADDGAAPPRDLAMKDGVKALMSLPSGTVVCFVDANGPLATVRDGGSAKAPRWALRPYVDLTAARGAGPTASSQLPALPADSLFTIQRSGDRVTFRSLGAEGRTLQAVSGGEHQLVNYNLGPWESWVPHKEHGLVNVQWGVPLGMGLAVVHAALAADVKEASRRAARDLRQLHAAAHAAQQRSTEMERQVALAEAAARAEAGKGWQALQAKLSTTDAARAAASRTLAEQAAALEASERRRERAEADLMRAAGAGAAAAKAAKSAAAKQAEAEARAAAAEERLRARDAALAEAEAERKELIAALREAVHAAKHAEKEKEKHHKAEAPKEKEHHRHHHQHRDEKEKEKEKPPKESAAPIAPAVPATVESKPAGGAARVAAEALHAIRESASARPPPSASKAAGRERERPWPAAPPHPIWCASPATMPLSRLAQPAPPAAQLPPPAARTPPRAESLTALAAEAALLPPSDEEGSFATASDASGSGSGPASASGAIESAGSTQLSGGGAHPLPGVCRTPGSARKRLQMDAAAMPSVGPARAELVAESATRPARAERGRERDRERERDRSADGRRRDSERRNAEHADRDAPAPAPRAAPKPAREARPAPPPAAAKPAAKAAPRPAAVSFKAAAALDGELPPAPREPLGRRSVNDLFLGLWEPMLGGATPSVPRRAAIEAQPRLAGWMPHGVEEENEY